MPISELISGRQEYKTRGFSSYNFVNAMGNKLGAVLSGIYHEFRYLITGEDEQILRGKESDLARMMDIRVGDL